MHQSIALEWASRLRQSKQTIDKLRDGDCFCALGVLGDLAVSKGLAKWQDNCLVSKEYAKSLSLPSDIKHWAGIKDEEVISDMNDEQRKSFEEIATYIEKNYEKI